MQKMNQVIAVEVLREVRDVLNEHGVEHFLIYGTLLGAVRDGKFCDGETDIDIGVKHEILILKIRELMDAFRNRGFTVYGYSYPYNQTRALNLIKHDIIVDIRNFEEWDGVRFLQRVDSSRNDVANVWSREHFETLGEIEFYGMKFKIPSNPEEWLRVNYGDSWRTPDPDMHVSYAGVEGWWTKTGRTVLVNNEPL